MGGCISCDLTSWQSSLCERNSSITSSFSSFELSDVAFCIISRYNQTFSHLSREHSCSCNIHYLNLNRNLTEETLISYPTNYLRLTPLCQENDTESTAERDKLILRNLEDQCDYQLTFLDCDAMTTTTVRTTTVPDIEITNHSDTSTRLTTRTVISSTTPK